MHLFRPFFAVAVLSVLVLVAPTSSQTSRHRNSSGGKESANPDPLMLKSIQARSIGPAIMSGRVSSIALDPEDINTFYIGLGTGGIMKTSDDGASFGAIFEKEAVAAIGAIAVSPSRPNHVWAGTGEANDRNSSAWGNGVYHSTDGGGSWTNVGLKESKTIARIVVHPTDTNTVYVAAMGDLWTPNDERGLYKTTDAGKTWSKILSAKGHPDKVGCGDVAIDPANPNTVYAVLYARMRTPWSFSYGMEVTGGNDAGGIFKSTDGGGSWTKLTNGLPGATGRIGLDIYRKNPSVVYAVIQSDEGGTSDIDDPHSKRGGVFRSDDHGDTWRRMSPLDPRPFYFSQIRVDPTNEQRVYVLGYMLHVSDDSGKTFQEDFFDKVHPDCHALVVDPRNAKRLIIGTDGGAYQSYGSGKGWHHLTKFAAGEFYRITLDNSIPYRIAGGLQDNQNWVGPSNTMKGDGILNSDWIDIGGGDGFYCAFDPTDSNMVYAESQEGYVHRYNLKTGEGKGLRPQPAEGQMGFRFEWDSPLINAKSPPDALYLAGNHVFKLTDKGEHWKMISPDLSAQDPKKIMTVGSGAETYGVVYTLAESPLKAGVLWAGTDDGKLWMTTNEGETWTDLTGHLPREAKGQWISRIELGHFDLNTAYLAVGAYRTGNYSPLAYRTTDGGTSWESISGNLPADDPVKVVREDLSNPDLLFAGTEFGLYVSFERGEKWMKLGELPTVAVDDIVIHPRDRDLAIATHGRSLYIFDDIRPLEEFNADTAGKAAALFPVRPAYGYYPNSGSADWDGNATFRGSNPPTGAIINYFVKEFTGDGVKISIANSAGRTVANLSGPGTPGFNRVTWDLKPTKDLLNNYGGEGQKFVPSGDYTLNFSFGKTKATQKVHVEIAQGIETR